jgi:Caspase domain
LIFFQVDELGRVFEKEYNFTVNKAPLETDNAQKEMIFYLAQFLKEHDRKNTLLIIYYAGHGWAPPDQQEAMLISGQVCLQAREA